MKDVSVVPVVYCIY